MTTAIVGGQVVTPQGVERGDVLIDDQLIVAVGAIEPIPKADHTYDARGCYVLPGAIDSHTHLDMEVGAVRSADDFYSGTQAAACGGTTTVIDFATAYRGETPDEGLQRWFAKADGKAVVDYAFHMTITELTRSAEDIVDEMVESGITSFKLYMTYPDRLMVPDEVIVAMMRAARPRGVLISLHCEDDATVSRLRDDAIAAGRTHPRWHALSRPASAEADAVARAARMAEETGAPCYVVHLSSGAALEQVRLARDRGLPFFAETCPQYLYLTAERYEGVAEQAARYVCAPPLRGPQHQEELWEGLRAGHVQVVATDHCPFTSRDKRFNPQGEGWIDFTQIPGGLPGIETRLSLIYQRVIEGDLTLEQWVDRCCTAPARLFGLYPRKGELAPGADADVVVFDPGERRPLVPERLHMNCDYSVYEDMTVTGWPRYVLSRGRLVAERGEPRGQKGWGTFIQRGPSGAMA